MVPMIFFTQYFIVSSLTFKFLIHFELIFVIYERDLSSFSACGYQVFPASFISWKDCHISNACVKKLWKSVSCRCMRLFLGAQFCFLVILSFLMLIQCSLITIGFFSSFVISRCDTFRFDLFTWLSTNFVVFSPSIWILRLFFCEKCHWYVDGDFSLIH
jgi:hypothetical protein